MTTPTASPEEWIAEIEARANAATEGPWHLERHDQDDGSITYEIWAGSGDYRRLFSVNEKYDNDRKHIRLDTNFAANARTDIPRLIAELRAVRAEITADHAREEKIAQALDAVVAEERKLRAENVRLRAVADAGRRCVDDYYIASGKVVTSDGDGYGSLRALRLAIAALAAEGKQQP